MNEPRYMKNLFEMTLSVLCGIFAYLFSGQWMHLNFHQLLQINYSEIMKVILELCKVGMAGMVGAVGGAIGKKYLFPFFHKHCKRITTKKNKK